MRKTVNLIDFTPLIPDSQTYITKAEIGAIRGAIRKVFARSEFAKKVRQRARSDQTGPRGGMMIKCEICGENFSPKDIELHHLIEVVEIGKRSSDYTIDELIGRLWCDENNIVAICRECHKGITKEQQLQRNEINNKKRKRKGKK